MSWSCVGGGASFSFIDTDSVVGPDVDAFGDRVDDSVPHLCDVSVVPWAEGGV